MARIRSVHPGLASDEAFMSMSMACKAAWPLLWTECDDSGVFEWKPIVLKARIFPADTVDFAAILSELVSLGCVQKVDIDGRSYGLVRNFCRYQRPKKPNYRVLLAPEFRTYVALDEPSSEPVPHQYHTSGEKPPQMEDGVGVGKGDGENIDIKKIIFPDDGSIEFGRWAKIVRSVSPGNDVDTVASAFRGWCRMRDIAFDDPMIEQKFTTFSSKFRRKASAA